MHNKGLQVTPLRGGHEPRRYLDKQSRKEQVK
jgi:hypothetical protein